MGRSWTVHVIEDECPCPKAPCGLAMPDGQPAGSCPEHNPADPLMSKTMRQLHTSEQCPGRAES